MVTKWRMVCSDIRRRSQKQISTGSRDIEDLHSKDKMEKVTVYILCLS